MVPIKSCIEMRKMDNACRLQIQKDIKPTYFLKLQKKKVGPEWFEYTPYYQFSLTIFCLTKFYINLMGSRTISTSYNFGITHDYLGYIRYPIPAEFECPINWMGS